VGVDPVLLLLGADGASFSAFEMRTGPGTPELALDLEPTADLSRFRDRTTGNHWSETGIALDGPNAGARLQPLAAYQEFWHSWRTFHPETTARRQ
jgi:hypothetical protein